MKNAKTAVFAKFKEVMLSRMVRIILIVVFAPLILWDVINTPHKINKMSAMRLYQQEINKHSLEPSYSDGGTLYLIHYEDQQYVKDILARCKPSFLGKWRKYETARILIRLGEYRVGSVGDRSPYYFLPSRAIFSGHEFRLSKEDNKMLWEFLYSIENRQ